MNLSALPTSIKSFFIILNSIYTFGKFLGFTFTRKTYLFSLLFSILATPFVCYVQISFPLLTLIAATLCIMTISYILFRHNILQTLSISILSIGSNYALFTVLVLITVPIISLLVAIDMAHNHIMLLVLSLIGLLQTLIVYLLFHTKRLRNGISIVTNPFLGKLGIFIGIILILFSSALFIDSLTLVYVLLISFVSALAIIIWLWWQKSIQTDYINKNNFQQIDILESKLQERDAELERLSKIIHKDNKLLAALELSTREILTDASSEKAQSLLQELNRFSKERSETLHAYESGSAALPETGLFSVDTMIRYLHQRALKHKIEFQLSLEGELAGITDVICEQDLCTIIADLGENAVIATRESEIKNIRLSMERKPDGYALYFYDSGEPFAKEVLENLGKKRYTTHAETGGSGIGLMTTSELVAKYHGAFYITDEEIPEPYTKCVVVKLLIP